MAPQKTIYVKDADLPVWGRFEKAVNLGATAGSVSALIADAMHQYLAQFGDQGGGLYVKAPDEDDAVTFGHGVTAVLVKDATGKRIVRTSDIAAHVRGQTGRPIVWASLHSRVIEIGWEHPGQVQQRQPNGHGKVKARIYVIPPGWEHL